MNLHRADWQAYPAQDGTGEHTVVGTLKVLSNVHSTQLRNRRDILIYLPPSYATSNRRYPVIYMQDGQNLFDRTTSFVGGEWQVDETMELLSQEAANEDRHTRRRKNRRHAWQAMGRQGTRGFLRRA